MQHTKTPWRVGTPSQMGSVVADEPVPEIKGSDAVEYYGGHLIAESIAPRNAEFIVRACNAHDLLVTALSEMMEYARMVPDEAIDGCSMRADYREALKNARAALLAAEAQ